MSIFREIPPTAGFPLLLPDLLPLSWHDKALLEEDFKSYLGAPYTEVSCSGTAAFYLILEVLKELSSKKTVVIPSFICPLVPLAIQRAGLKVLVCDINKDNFGFNTAQLEELCSDNSDLLAIIPVHLGGIPVDLGPILESAKRNKIFVVEDCAQSLGAEYKGRKVGTLGDFSFFSLCRGKGLTIYEGGVIVTNKAEYILQIDKKIKELLKNNFFSEAVKIFEIFGYWIFYRPLLFWFIFRLPQLFWQWQDRPLKAMIEDFNIDFPLHKVSEYRKLIGHAAFGRLDKEIEMQREKALYYFEKIKEIKGIKVILESAGDKANYPYLTLIFEKADMREKALKELRNSGLGVSQIYTLAITDYSYLKEILEDKDLPNARALAQRHITLSTSTFLNKRDLEKVIEKIKKL